MNKNVENYLNDEVRIYKISISLLIFSLIWFVASVFLDIAMEDNGSFAHRSGAIIVLFGVVVEFALSNINFKNNSSSVSVEEKLIETAKETPLIYNYLKRTAHVYIIVGTFIWGYIDILWKYF